MNVVPRKIHMIYFPWGKDHRLLSDPHAFDQGPYEKMRAYAPDFEVILWTLPVAEKWCSHCCPQEWRLIRSLPHPTMMVDFLRWLLVYHHGGIYWQYDMDPLVPMESMLPSPPKQARLFTEFVLSHEARWAAASEPIRKGVPEEPIRVMNQAFAATPGHPFVQRILEEMIRRCRSEAPKRDYDILYICANALVSTVYERFGSSDPTVELVDRNQRRTMLHVAYKGTWRTRPVGSIGAKSEQAKIGVWTRLVASLATRLREHAGMARLRFIWLGKMHHHANICVAPATQRQIDNVLCMLEKTRGDPAVLASANPVLIYPEDPNLLRACRNGGGAGGVDPGGAGDGSPLRGPCASPPNRINLLFSRLSPAKIVVCLEFLNCLSYKEIQRVIEHLRAEGVVFLICHDYPLLNSNWDTTPGDFRPVNFSLAPFLWRAQLETHPDPQPGARTDRRLALWCIR